jgi:triacylglycerol lipase
MSLAAHVRLWLLVLVGTGTLLAWALLPDSAPWWLPWLLGAVAPVPATGLVLAIEMVVGATVDPPSPARPLRALLRGWWVEMLDSAVVFGWRQPWRAGFAEPPLVRDAERPDVLLIHGYVCNRAVWQPLLASGALNGCNVATVNLEPVFASIDDYAAVIDAAVGRLRTGSGAAQVVLVCHSMGGVAARAYLRRYGSGSVARVVTLATPHAGTVVGRIGIGRNARQMAYRSAWLRELAAGEDEALRARFVCIATRDDNLIVPRSSPLLPGARHEVIDGVGHLALLADPRAWELIARYVAPNRPQRP